MVQDRHTLHCARCGSPVREGPEGGYVCPLCFHVMEPPGEEQRRKDARRERMLRVEAAQRKRRRELEEQRLKA
jgi:uncharacterized Zn finger protein (UPF0148 family)